VASRCDLTRPRQRLVAPLSRLVKAHGLYNGESHEQHVDFPVRTTHLGKTTITMVLDRARVEVPECEDTGRHLHIDVTDLNDIIQRFTT
jgi:hypothetical protein